MTQAITVNPDATVTKAVMAMLDSAISELPVVDENRALLGIVAEADLFRAQLRQPRDVADVRRVRTVADVMRTPPVSVSPTDEVELCRRLLETHVRSLPVVDDRRRVVGQVSRRDLMRSVTESDEDLLQLVMSRLPVPADNESESPVSVLDGVVTVSVDPATVAGRKVARAVKSIPSVRHLVLRPPAPGSNPRGARPR